MTSLPTPAEEEGEGVIKFSLDFTQAPLQRLNQAAELKAWRQIMFRLALTGQDPLRYGGLAFGNVSLRDGPPGFLISGTATGGKPSLGDGDFSRVLGFDLGRNFVRAEGPIEPSSEALTHAAVYAANPEAGCVIHVHSPEIWRNAQRLDIGQTDGGIAYGTPEMAWAVASLASQAGTGVIAMGGHEDGIIAFAPSTRAAALSLLEILAKALEAEAREPSRPG